MLLNSCVLHAKYILVFFRNTRFSSNKQKKFSSLNTFQLHLIPDSFAVSQNLFQAVMSNDNSTEALSKLSLKT